MSGRCVACGKIVRYPYDGQPFHSQGCARVLLQRILISVPGVVDLLPPKWRGDLPTPRETKRRRTK